MCIRDRAWVLNYSNPAAIVAEATKRVFPGDKRIINICDMPVGIMNQYADELGVPRNSIEARYFGLNHYGWFTAILDKKTGEDYLPRLREIFSEDLPEDAFSDIDPSWSATFHFMRKMCIRDRGTHEELMATCEVYREIAESQLYSDAAASAAEEGGCLLYTSRIRDTYNISILVRSNAL